MTFQQLRNIMIKKIPQLLYIKNETQTFNCQIKKEENKEIKILFEDFLKENPQYQTLFILFTSLNQNDPLRKCLNPNCNNYLTRLRQRTGRLYCCAKCKNSSPIYKENLKKGVQEKYGVDNVFQAKEIKEKIKQTNLQRYGTEHYQSTNTFKQFMHDNNPAYDPNIIQKRKDTCLERFGKISYYATDIAKQKLRERNLDAGWEIVKSFQQYGIIPLFARNEYKGYFDFQYKWKCLKCGNEFTSRIYITNYNKNCKILPRCLHCFPFIEDTGSSQMQRDLSNFCRQYFPNLLPNNKEFIKPKEIDILIPQLKLAIEFNGLYWHSLENKPIGYHLNKLNEVEAKGYRLIQIWEQDWIFKQDEIKEHLISIFEGREIIPTNVEYLDRDWYTAPNNSEIIKPEIEQIDFINNMSVQFERTRIF